MTRLEFERRYTAMSNVKKAELIEGTVYMASPLRFEPHAEPHGDLIGWLWTYTDENGAVCSQVLPGLWLAVRALLAGDMSGVLTVLQEAINSTEHAAFVKRLADARGSSNSLYSKVSS